MPLTRPTELRSFLDSLGVRAKKSLSQNFLIDGNIIRKILATASVSENDLVLEIGAGPGALTEALLDQKANVIAIEKDETFAEALNRFPKLEIFAGDFKDFPFIDRGKKAKVVANLPYQLTALILSKLLPRHDLFSSLTVMVQEEVARRIVAKPHTADFGSFSVFCQFYSTPKIAFLVSNRCFYPVPKVQSAVLHFELQKKYEISQEEEFFAFVRKAFSQRRKMVKNCLELPTVEHALNSLNLLPTVRAENLSLDNFINLFNILNNL